VERRRAKDVFSARKQLDQPSSRSLLLASLVLFTILLVVVGLVFVVPAVENYLETPVVVQVTAPMGQGGSSR